MYNSKKLQKYQFNAKWEKIYNCCIGTPVVSPEVSSPDLWLHHGALEFLPKYLLSAHKKVQKWNQEWPFMMINYLGKRWAKWQSINYDYPKSFQWFSRKKKQENFEKERIKTQKYWWWKEWANHIQCLLRNNIVKINATKTFNIKHFLFLFQNLP